MLRKILAAALLLASAACTTTGDKTGTEGAVISPRTIEGLYFMEEQGDKGRRKAFIIIEKSFDGYIMVGGTYQDGKYEFEGIVFKLKQEGDRFKGSTKQLLVEVVPTPRGVVFNARDRVKEAELKFVKFE
jgi:hypothetical protein